MVKLINARAQLAYEIMTKPDHDGMSYEELARRMDVDEDAARAACGDLELVGLLNCCGPVAVSSAVFRSHCEKAPSDDEAGK